MLGVSYFQTRHHETYWNIPRNHRHFLKQLICVQNNDCNSWWIPDTIPVSGALEWCLSSIHPMGWWCWLTNEQWMNSLWGGSTTNHLLYKLVSNLIILVKPREPSCVRQLGRPNIHGCEWKCTARSVSPIWGTETPPSYRVTFPLYPVFTLGM